MAADISSIIQNELVNTFDSLLSLSSSVDKVSKVQDITSLDEKHIKIEVKVSFSSSNSDLIFYLPNEISTKFEYFMLGGIGESKQSIDDEIVDAVKEIISTVGGGLSTTINAQGFDDVSKFSFNLEKADISEESDISKNVFKFDIKLNDDEVSLYMQFDDTLLPFISSFNSGTKIVEEKEESGDFKDLEISPKLDSLLSILGENSSDNLKLLFDVRLKFSVRLGSKTFLLKDIVNWDLGQIIELEQMVNEPLDILINNVKVGVGEAVIVEGKFGIKIKYIGED